MEKITDEEVSSESKNDIATSHDILEDKPIKVWVLGDGVRTTAFVHRGAPLGEVPPITDPSHHYQVRDWSKLPFRCDIENWGAMIVHFLSSCGEDAADLGVEEFNKETIRDEFPQEEYLQWQGNVDYDAQFQDTGTVHCHSILARAWHGEAGVNGRESWRTESQIKEWVDDSRVKPSKGSILLVAQNIVGPAPISPFGPFSEAEGMKERGTDSPLVDCGGAGGVADESNDDLYRHLDDLVKHIVLKTTLERLRDAEGKSFANRVATYAAGSLARKCTLVMTVEDLRKNGLNIRRGLSWEQLSREMLEEMSFEPLFKNFTCVLIVLRHEGCLVWFPPKRRGELIYHPGDLEGSFESRLGYIPFATMSLFQAEIARGVARWILEKGDYERKVIDAAKQGLASIRWLLKNGFPLGEGTIGMPDPSEFGSGEEGDSFGCLGISPDVIAREFSILHSLIPENLMRRLAGEFVRMGNNVLKKQGYVIPYFQAGSLVTYERREIEQFSNLRHLLANYLADDEEKPLSICVFGNPGSGKSFAVKKIAGDVGFGEDAFFEFNLSQMEGYDDLADAFHRVADAGTRGKVPLVFFDEFDSTKDGERFGWLKYFLAPMQDGIYRERRLGYSTGKAVFVFAGGTCSNHSAFFAEAATSAPSAKAKDFLSRIKGYVDIKGINPAGEGEPIPYLKRAVLMRGHLMGRLGEKVDSEVVLDIDEKVLDAFLQTSKFNHDARSMGSIIATSVVAPGCKIVPSCIVNDCLDLHVTSEFQGYLRSCQ